MTEAYLCDGVRTPIGRFGGALAHVRTDDLAAIPLRALLARNAALDPAAIDEIVLGCANQAGEDNRDVARMAGLLAGLPVSVPGTTLNRLCASGLDAVGTAARAIQAGQIDLAIAGGVESMSRAPFVMAKAETAFQRSSAIEDTTIGWRFVNPVMKAQYGVDSMPETAENVAEFYGVDRLAQDRFAVASQQRVALASAAGWFAGEIVAVETHDAKRRPVCVAVDEHPRAGTTLAGLSSLKAPFRVNGSVTAGNASGVNDGAAAMFIASAEAVKAHALRPLARIAGMATAGVEPRLMGIGPVPATRKLLARLGWGIGECAVIEINEAFAAQVLACLRQLDVDPEDDRVNANGGAIALGHPLGMSGARLALTAARACAKAGAGRALVTLCVGVGQGVALALEAV
ncbi:3-oxoadipyl-CoA thiolase [Sphingomonas sp.]|uniref:3-oxoadipyl-CoA thiolase n=1 Tax=Sphingomonas sp. TaxID=28214 RepID=UPI000DB365F8|nr:3-oxoadipyl-CoA thiolase [Sphingomonas sp.]PZU10781.1 MAG: 3-oxoadipyl-CoA thiolase [Sphingomonas sp.]